jgi:diaminohydroxyphosphoribosylaminopyrimidine deaminase / 5-amino-6-(5-phosphoribosylamino)uracil reductase
MLNKTDAVFMKTAIKLAKKGGNRVFPNPLVGAVVVKDGKIVGSGYHKYFGGPHAEVYALNQAGSKASGATLYVSLEPCAHWGKTPPCANLIISSKIARVVAASGDPNPKTSGKGFKKLSNAGIKLTCGTLKNDAMKMNPAYFNRFKPNFAIVPLCGTCEALPNGGVNPVSPAKRRDVTARRADFAIAKSGFKRKRTYCIIKAAMSLDGKINTRTGDSQWISCRKSRELVHKLRGRMDAVLVGINTVIADNPYLTSHGHGRNPVRIILDPDLRVPLNSNVLNNEATTIIFTSANIKNFKNPRVIQVRISNRKKYDLKYIFSIIKNMSIYSVLIEGGGETIASAIEYGVADEIMFFFSPKIVGGRDAKTAVEGLGVSKMADARALKSMKIKKVGTDILIMARLK